MGFDDIVVDNLPDRFVKYRFESSLGECRTFNVFNCSDLFSHFIRTFPIDWFHSLLTESFLGGRIFSEIEFGSNQNDGYVWCVMIDFRKPLLLVMNIEDCLLFWGSFTHLRCHVIKRWRTDYRETDQEDIRLRVWQWTKSIIIFLSGSIPQT